ncbi:MAG: adenylate/guanylate cyclase domain-containing protein, partial [Chloroflexota bacterium]|nr:adenylate/guanylate cyclase domain-containing protein [Chloroflexota bacterium]
MGIRDLPSGTVTFLFTDVEGSTRLLHELGAERYAEALATHRRVLREAFTRHGGVEVDTQGDAFFVAFPTAPGALAAALETRHMLSAGPIRVRIGLHTGTPLLAEEGYIGPDVHKGARIAAAGHGGQVLVSSATASLLDGADLRDLGQHRLKDLTAPERIYQGDPDDHPPLMTLHQTNLPVPATPFLGREAELDRITALLTRDGVRLVTLTGPGGTGKTRLALQAAADVADLFPDGVWWVPLAALRDPTLVLPEVERAIGARPPLAEHLATRRMLVVLDNFEQVVDAGPSVSRLLADCPALRILVTSRALLEVGGEREFRVPPLDVEQAVALFAERTSTTPDADVRELCLRLDCLPLAVELAAARARHLSPREMVDRIGARLDLFRGARDVDPRHATLRATIEWSYRLLAPDAQALFARLAVFRGGWSLTAAEAVAGAHIDDLAILVDQSLVVRDGERFAMLETIREFAVAKLAESPEAGSVRERHLAYMVETVERWYADRLGAPTRWFAAVDSESDNIRQALDHAATREGPEEQRLVGAVAVFWAMHGYGAELLTRLEAAVSRRDEPDEWRARALIHLGAHTANLERLQEA